VGRSAGFILLCTSIVGERWAKHGVVTVIILIKRERPQLLQCNPCCISTHKEKGWCTPPVISVVYVGGVGVELSEVITIQRRLAPQKKNLRRIHF